ncbi:MAG TPA: Trk system potassium transporter TrkA, partial [Saprospiraceae bacterium]|nr:Trk system potassium transporter TrkA [Saprospiraceae bacterium]
VKKTIARVNNPEYLQEEQKENFFKLGVDTLISPQQLAAQEIERLLRQSSFTDIFEFEGGKISIVGFTIEETSIIANKSFLEFNNMTPNFSCRGIAILRNHKTIIPRGDTIIKQGDHMYMVVQNKQIDEAKTFAGKKVKKLKRVMIIGGSKLALRTAEKLEDKYSVSIVVNDKKTGDDFLETLHNALVIVADYGNVDILKEEGLERMDAFVALTPNSEINIITSLMAEEVGVYKTIALVDNTDYTHISQNIGIDTIINKKLIAANNIFRFVRKGNIQAIGGLHGVDAEVIEFIVHKKNRLLKHPIKNLHLPKKSIIAGVVRGNNSYIPDGDFQLEQNDKVIVFTQPEAIRKVEEIFK